MKKSKTFAEAVMAGAAAVALVGLVYAGGKSKTVVLKATTAHTIALDGAYSNKPATLGVTQLSDSTFGLSSGGYIVADFEGTGDKVNTGGTKWLFTSSANSNSGTQDLSLSIDIYANNITSASFVAGTNLSSAHAYKTDISLYGSNYVDHTSSESALKSSTTATSITKD
jgi:hypothetical protein